MDPHSLQNLKVLAINSFAVHGTASLKAITKILGTRVLPVPSVLLNGLTNMPGVSKYDSPLKELLKGTFELAIHRKQKLILYIGYLGTHDQIDLILDYIEKYKAHIIYIISDPICGDHGKAYISKEIIEKWPALIRKSNMVFPNLTEVKLLTNNKSDGNENYNYYVDQFLEKFPNVELVVTSVKKDEQEIGVQLYSNTKFFAYYHSLLSRNFGGSGDAFVALYIYYHFYKSYSQDASLKQAALTVSHFIERSIDAESDELIITH